MKNNLIHFSLQLGFLFLLLLGLSSCEDPKNNSKKNPNKIKPNLILITLDTTRADRLGCYGYSKIQTPNLDQLAKEGIQFNQAMSPVPLTLPSHSSLLTGQYPIAHGVHDNIGFILPKEIQTLAELLKEKGYQTGAFLGSMVLQDTFGLAQGFTKYEQTFTRLKPYRKANTVFKHSKEWVEENKKKPFFAWIHLYDPHHPHEAPEPFKSHYESSYDAEISYTDAQIGKFIDFLKKKKKYQNSLIIVVGDHGESLGEHQEDTHGFFAYDATLKIPLLMKLHRPLKTNELQVIQDQVRIIDVMPTILSNFGLPIPKEVQGVDLSPLIRGEKTTLNLKSYGESYFAFHKYGFSKVKTLRTNQYKLIDTQQLLELYDIQKDPNELKDLSKTNEALTKKLKAELDAYIQAYHSKTNARVKLDGKTMAELASIGYSGPVFQEEKEGVIYPNIKENGWVNQELLLANKEITEKKFEKAQQRLDKISRKYSQPLAFAYELQANLHFGKKEFKKAKVWLEKVIELREPETTILHKLALCSFANQDFQEAIKILKSILKIDPNYDEARENLWKLYFRTKNSELALADIQQQIKKNPSNGSGWFWLGKFKETQKADQEALESYLKATTDPRYGLRANFLAGKLYLKKKDEENAIGAFKKVVAQDPNFVKGWVQLGNLYSQLKKRESARDSFEKALQLKPERFIFRQNIVHLNIDLGEKDKAYKHILEGLELDLTAKERLTLLRYLVVVGKSYEALNGFIALVEEKPDLVEAHLFLGQLALKLKHPKQAIKSYTAFLKLYQKDDETRKSVSALLEELQKRMNVKEKEDKKEDKK